MIAPKVNVTVSTLNRAQQNKALGVNTDKRK